MMTTTISKLVIGTVEAMQRGARKASLALTLGLKPVPAARPRVGRFGTYYPKTYEKFRRTAEAIIADAAANEYPILDGPLEVTVESVITPPKAGKYDYPKANGDVDNLAKGPLDALTKAEGVFWNDDSQIVALHVFKRYALPEEQEGFHIHWRELDDADKA